MAPAPAAFAFFSASSFSFCFLRASFFAARAARRRSRSASASRSARVFFFSFEASGAAGAPPAEASASADAFFAAASVSAFFRASAAWSTSTLLDALLNCADWSGRMAGCRSAYSMYTEPASRLTSRMAFSVNSPQIRDANARADSVVSSANATTTSYGFSRYVRHANAYTSTTTVTALPSRVEDLAVTTALPPTERAIRNAVSTSVCAPK